MRWRAVLGLAPSGYSQTAWCRRLMLLRRCALLAGVSVGAASPRHDPAFFDGTWDDRILGGGITAGHHEGAVAPPSCRAGLCAGAGARYPTGPGVVFESEYNIPEIPSSFGPDTSLTDYLCAAGALFLPVLRCYHLRCLLRPMPGATVNRPAP